MTTSPQARERTRPAVTRETLLARAEALVPHLSERSAEAERLRRCPDDSIADFVENGLLRICQPARFGGYELGWDVLCEVSQTLARGCGSQAWVQSIFCDHAQKVGTFPLQAQDDIWGKDPDTRVASSFDPIGKARTVEGGVLYSGRQGFSSGIDHAQWLICGGRMVDGETPGRRCFFLVPMSDATIVDDWHVVGLAGTGSKSFEIRDAFVPAHRILDGEEGDTGISPGAAINTAPIFRLPRRGVTKTGFAAIGVGIAQGFLENYLSYTGARKSRGMPVAELMGTQISAGIASAEIEAAERMNLGAAREAMAVLERGEVIPRAEILRISRNAAFAGQTALQAVMRLYPAAGGRALQTGNAMQRQVRDLMAVASHHALVWDTVAAAYGQHALGLDEH